MSAPDVFDVDGDRIRQVVRDRFREHAATQAAPAITGPGRDQATAAAILAHAQTLVRHHRRRQTRRRGELQRHKAAALAAADALARLIPSIECVLIDHVDELDDEHGRVDANLAELAHVYRELTGFDARTDTAEQTGGSDG